MIVMKFIYTQVFLLSFVLFGCSKDFLKSYENRIIGTWRIADVKRVGIGGNTDNLPFKSGTLNFHENGTLEYVNSTNVNYQGTWEIVKRTLNDQTIQSLQVTAIDFTNQHVLAEYYDDMNFRSTNHFSANIVHHFHTYITHFRR